MPKTEKVDRTEIYKDRNVQAFLNRLLSSEINEIEPSYDPKIGYHYPFIEQIVGNPKHTVTFLDRLHEAEIVERRLYDKIIHCPKCGSVNVSVRYCCPYCKSFNIHKSSLIEHVKCGYMDVEENFRHGNDILCPKCNKKLEKSGVDYRQAGIWCTCNECTKSFDIPSTDHFCRACHTTFTFEAAIIKDVYSYRLKDEVKEEAEIGWIIISPISELLSENGFRIESPAFLKGRSGANHLFDIVAYKEGLKKEVKVIDFTLSPGETVGEQPVIALFAKIFDVSPDDAYLIVIPRISENGKKMAKLYKISLIEAIDDREAIEKFKERLLG